MKAVFYVGLWRIHFIIVYIEIFVKRLHEANPASVKIKSVFKVVCVNFLGVSLFELHKDLDVVSASLHARVASQGKYYECYL